MSRESNHTCHAALCDTHVPPRMHMCTHHWRMVPKHLQRSLWKTYRPGQERTLSPSPAYLLAAARCVHAVAVQEGLARETIEHEVGLYEAWHNLLVDEPADFMVIIEGVTEGAVT